MNYWLSPELFNNLAITLSEFRWKLLGCSLLSFLLFGLLYLQIEASTPISLIWLAVFILFIAIQTLVFATFIFFFQVLQSNRIQDKQWYRFYRTIEWCEAILFGFILPLPAILFIYAFITI